MQTPPVTRRTLLTAMLGSVAVSSDSEAAGARYGQGGSLRPALSGAVASHGRHHRIAGINLPLLAWYVPLRSMTNLAAYGPWQANAQFTVVDPAIIDRNGDIIGFPPGVSNFQKVLGLPSTSGSHRIRLETTGAPADGFICYAHDVDQTHGADHDVDPPIFWHECTYTVDLAAPITAPPLFIAVSRPGVRNTFCAEVTGRTPNNGRRTPFVETGFWHSRFLDVVRPFGEIRFLDPSFVNSDCGRDYARPVTAANRARRLTAAQPNVGTGTNNAVGANPPAPNPCHAAAGGLNLVAADHPITGPGMVQIATERSAALRSASATVTALPGVAEFMPYGASGNAMTLVIHPPDGTGSVSFDSLALTLHVTPAAGAASGDAVLKQIAATKDVRVLAVVDVLQSTGRPEPVSPGSYRFNGGFSPQVQGDLGIEEAVDLCIATNCNMHWCLPVAVADDYLELVGRELARLIPHGLRADVEVGNEVWNSFFLLQYWQLATRTFTRDLYGFAKINDPLYNVAGHVFASVLDLTAHARAIIKPFFAAAPDLVRFCMNLQPGVVGYSMDSLRKLSPAFAKAYDETIDVNMSGAYITGADNEAAKLDGIPGWQAGAGYAADKVVEDGGTAFFARNAVSGPTPPHQDPGNWGRLAGDQAAIARILEKQIDAEIGMRALDAAQSRALGKAYKVYEGALQIATNDHALVDQITNGPGVAEAVRYLMMRYRAACGPDAPFLWYCLVYGDGRGWSLGHSTESFPTLKSQAFVETGV